MRFRKMMILPLIWAATATLSTTTAAGQPAPAPSSANPPPLQMCLHAAADFSPVYPTNAFPSFLREITCVYEVQGNESFKKLTCSWIAVDTGDTLPANHEITHSDIKAGKRGSIEFKANQPLPVGKYRLDVRGDGNPWQSIEFTVVPSQPVTPVKDPNDLMPLKEGQKWTYDVSESGEAAMLLDEDDHGGANQKAKVEMKVAGVDADGAHIEYRSKGAIVSETWWQLNKSGLVMMRIKENEHDNKFDPPQVMLALPLENTKKWNYSAKDAAMKRSYQMWGPLPMKGPQGDVPGYVVLAEATPSFGKTSMERHFVPGVGIVREVDIATDKGGNLMDRKEMTLSTRDGAAATTSTQSNQAQPKAAGPIQMCLTTASDFSPIYPATEFPGNVRELSCAFQVGDQDVKKVTSIWTAIDVGDVAPPNYEMARNDLALNGMKRGRLRYSQNGPMPVGKYKVDVLADDKPWQSLQFAIVKPSSPVQPGTPAELFPLDEGRAWKYNFVQQAGAGVTITLPGAETDAEGKLHTSVTMTIAKAEPAGTHVEIRRAGDLVAEEWWKTDSSGLISTQRKVGGEMVTLDPPQILWPLQLGSPKEWKYEANDGSFTQNNQMWGPLPLNDPGNPGPGYIVFIEQPGAIKITVERHFVPGVGLVRETIIQAMNGDLVSKTDMTLAQSGTMTGH